ncbi:hypothetical protein [Streptomyces sp. NPDC005408]|uniref:hypothetical protein n=1 Tax=Streptomyces sp. NPDC005408 TaxID=3155341 RepID=UPI0033A26274
MSERVALSLVRRILTDALETRRAGDQFVRNLAGRIGELEQAIAAAVTVMDELSAGDSDPGLALAQRILADVIAPVPPSLAIDRNYVRTLAARVGALQQAMRAALTVLELAEGAEK